MPEKKVPCPNCDKPIVEEAKECPECKFNIAEFNLFGLYSDLREKQRAKNEEHKRAEEDAKKPRLFRHLGGSS